MNEKRKDAVKIEVSEEEAGHQDNQPQEGLEAEEVKEENPLENMSETELLQKIDEFREKAEKNYDQYLRGQAEMDNLIKRNKKDKEEWLKYSNETLIKDLLPVIDNLEKAISHANNENSISAIKEGVELTLKGLKDTLAKSGLEEIVAKGKTFDPHFHHAVAEQEDEKIEAGSVIDEFQKGYSLNQRLIRPSMVIISKGKPTV